MSDTEELKNMILNFRVSELQVLLGFAGRNKSGKKQEMQARALDLVKLRSAPIQMKIKELHKRRFHMVNMNPACDPPPDPSTLQCSIPPMGSQMKSSAYTMQRNNGGLPPNAINHSSNMGYAAQGKQMPPSVPASSAPSTYPVYPDVRLKPLPFYDILAELLKPASLMPNGNGRFQENPFVFHLTPQQAHDVAVSRDLRPVSKNEYNVQIQLRFCLLETSCEQDDNFPPSICVKVNNKICPLPNPIPTNKPGVEPKRPSRPVNITGLCRLSPTVSNNISVSWASEYGRAYAVAVYLVRRLSSSTLLQRLKSNGVRNPDHTRAMIKEKLQHDPDSEIATTSLRGSLICPLGKMRMQIPCRAVTCTHLQCFDASLYLQMNEKKPTWICPVCDKPATFKNLAIDGLFMEITTKAPSESTEVQFHEDGSWTPLLHKKEAHVINSPVVQRSPEKIMSSQPEKRPKIEVVDLTIESNSEDEEDSSLSRHISQSHHTQSSSARLGLPSSLTQSLPSSLSLIPTTVTSAPLISLPSPSSTSPSSSLSSTSSVISSYAGVISSTLSSIASNTTTSVSPAQYSTSQLSMPTSLPNARSSVSTPVASSSQGMVISSGPQASSSSSHSPVLGNTMYPNMPIINPATPPYYPPVSSPFRDYLPTAPQGFSGYTNFDLFSLLQPTETDRQVPTYSSVNSAVSGRKTSSSTPDVISLD